MNIKNASIINPSKGGIQTEKGVVTITANTGSMWGKGNSCSDIIIFPKKLKKASVELSLRFMPETGGEQAGIVLYIDNDNYIKLVREMVGNEHTIVLAKEIAGEPSTELLTAFESAVVDLRLDINSDSITVNWKGDKEMEFQEAEFPNWFDSKAVFQVGLLVHGNNSENNAEFFTISINGKSQS
jgi:regulation of enolase protein 1 (concanavalin A-like superfamily)